MEETRFKGNMNERDIFFFASLLVLHRVESATRHCRMQDAAGYTMKNELHDRLKKTSKIAYASLCSNGSHTSSKMMLAKVTLLTSRR